MVGWSAAPTGAEGPVHVQQDFGHRGRDALGLRFRGELVVADGSIVSRASADRGRKLREVRPIDAVAGGARVETPAMLVADEDTGGRLRTARIAAAC
jgi:hypothetical protein